MTFYGYERIRGRSFTTSTAVPNLRHCGFNDQASSAIVTGDRFEACEDVGFSGRCMIQRPVPVAVDDAYYDVTYTFRGVEQRVQAFTAPGAMIIVDAQNEPRA